MEIKNIPPPPPFSMEIPKLPKTKRTIEQIREEKANKLKELDRRILNKKIKKAWISELREIKSKLNKDKSKDYISKFESLQNWINSILQNVSDEYHILGYEHETKKETQV